MSDEALKSVGRKADDKTVGKGESDGARGRRGPASTVLLARTGLAVAAGATSMGGAMIEAGYSRATAANPTANGVTMQRALAAAAEAFPAAPTLRSLNARGLKAIDAAFDDPDVPALAKAQLGGNVVKLAAEVGEPDVSGSGVRHAWRQRRIVARAFAAGIACAERNGTERSRQILAGIIERDRTRFPYPVEILVPFAVDLLSATARTRARESKPASRED